MIAALLIWLYKKYAPGTFSKIRHAYKISVQQALKKALVLFILAPLPSHGQEIKLVYQVLHNGNIIGQMQFNRQTNGQNLCLQMHSSVKAKFIFPVTVETSDKACFSNGRLLYSAVYRSVNGREKENKKTRLVNNSYQLRSASGSGRIDQEINYNMLLLYCLEPQNIAQVYSDSFQQFLFIKKLTPHSYRIDLPNGSYNDYHFQNGTCRRVVVHHDWYTITMELV